MPVETAVRESAAGAPLFIYLSELLGGKVTVAGKPAGRLTDLKIKLGEPFPRVTALSVRARRGKKACEVDWAEVESFGDRAIVLRSGAESKFHRLDVGQDEILLRDELLDKQVVDTAGARIERVNDIHLLVISRDLHVVHVDIGARGLLRRLGWLGKVDRTVAWLFAYRLADKMISWKYIQPLLSGPDRKNLKLNITARRIHEIHPSDLADIIEELDAVNRSSLFRALDLQTAALTLEEVEDPKVQASLIESASAELASDILDEMAPDEATDLLADLPEDKKRSLMKTMEKPAREAVEELLQFREGTAGAIMTKDFFSVPAESTVGQAIEAFRATTFPLESVAYVYVTDKAGRLIGACTLRHLIISPRESTMGALMNPHLIKVEAEDKAGAVTELFRKYKFLALPVVDGAGALRGIVTLKDIMKQELEE